jgi:Tfp pilus assembly protein FimV
MNKVLLFSMVILTVLLVIACTSQEPASPPPEPPPPQPQPQSQPVAPEPLEEFTRNFFRHQSGIILDGATKYTVKNGDTLVSIARDFYQDGSYYPLILLASDDVVSDADRIYPGTELTVPVLKENTEDREAKKTMDNFFAQIASMEESRGRYDTAILLRSHSE